MGVGRQKALVGWERKKRERLGKNIFDMIDSFKAGFKKRDS